MTEPRLMTLQVTAEQADTSNVVQQVCARQAVFYRSERPPLVEDYVRGQHLRLTRSRNPVDLLLDHIPGVERRDRGLEDFALSLGKD